MSRFGFHYPFLGQISHKKKNQNPSGRYEERILSLISPNLTRISSDVLKYTNLMMFGQIQGNRKFLVIQANSASIISVNEMISECYMQAGVFQCIFYSQFFFGPYF